MNLTLIVMMFFLGRNLLIADDDSKVNCFKNPMFGLIYKQSVPDFQNELEDQLLLSQVQISSENLLSVFKLKTVDYKKREQMTDWVHSNCLEYLPREMSKPRYISEEEKTHLLDCRQEYYDSKIDNLKCDLFNVSRKAPFSAKEMTSRLLGVVENYENKMGIKPYLGEIHRWDEDHKSELRKQFPVAVSFNKVLVALALGVGSRYLVTDKDRDLRSWLESQEMTSVHVEDIFLKSLELQGGDVYKAILSISNVLSEFWKTPDRNNILQTSKLMSITNHCPGSRPEDVFGSWYHMFGMILYGCVSGPVAADFVARTESAGGRVLDAKSVKKQGENVFLHMLIGSDPQEEKINRISGHVGSRFCLEIKKRQRKEKD